MSKLMWVLGIVLLAVGVALALLGFVNPERISSQLLLQGFLQTAATLIVGGVLSIGLGGVIAAFQSGASIAAAPAKEDVLAETPAPIVVPAPEPEPEPAPVPVPTPRPKISVVSEETPKVTTGRLRFPGFNRKPAADVEAQPAPVPPATPEPPLTPAVKETIDALEQAKTDLNKALGGLNAPPPPPPPAIDEMVVDEAAAESDLYVVEDKVIRGRPARILSDGTVEAETEEGWMRFENLEHLNEYLDAVQAE